MRHINAVDTLIRKGILRECGPSAGRRYGGSAMMTVRQTDETRVHRQAPIGWARFSMDLVSMATRRTGVMPDRLDNAFHRRNSRHWFWSSSSSTTTTVYFDSTKSRPSMALLKQPTNELSPEEIELKECLIAYQQQSNYDPELLDPLYHAYMALEWWEEALWVEQIKQQTLLQQGTDEYADSIHVQGKLWLRQGNFEKSKELYDQALEYFQQTHHSVQEGHVWISLAGWHYFQHETSPQSLHRAMECLQRAEPLLDTNPSLLVKCLDNQGLVHRTWGDYESSLDKYQQALQVVVDPKTQWALQLHVADMYVALQEPQRALGLYQSLLAECHDPSNTTGPDGSGMLGVLWHNIATIHVQLGEYELAEQEYRQALQCKEQSAGRDNHPELAKTWNSLGALYHGLLNDSRQALECFRHVLWILRANSEYDDPRQDPEVLTALQTISDIEQHLDRERRTS